MKLWGVLILAMLGIAAVASPEILHPGGGSAPLEGLPLRMEFGGTGSSFTSFTDGRCVETYVDDNGTPSDTSDDLMKQRSASGACGESSAATPTPVVCAAGSALDRAHPEACVVMPTPKPSPTGMAFLANVETFTAAQNFEASVTHTSATNGEQWEDATGNLAMEWTSSGSGLLAPVGTGTVRASDVICTGCISTTDILNGTIAFADVDSTQTTAANPANGDASVWFGTTGLIFEGATSDTNEGLLNAGTISADRTWTLPNESGTICTLTSGCGTPAGSITAVGPACLAGACLMDETTTTGTTMFVWEGTTADANEFRIAAPSADPGADTTITFPNETGTVCTTGSVCTGYVGTLTAGTYIDITGSTVDVDLTEATAVTWGADGSATIGHTFATSGANDVTMNYTNGACTLSSTGSPYLKLDDADIAISGDGNEDAHISVGCSAGPSCTLSINRQVAGASLPVLQAISNGSIVIGDGGATAVSVTTDGTGDGEFNLPVGSIGTTEILDGTVVFADVNSTQALAADPANGASSVWFGTTGMIFEGATSDTFEGLLASADITTPDKTWTLPNETGTICTTGSVCSGYQAGPLSGDVVTSGAAATIQVNSVALTTDTTGDYVSSATASQGLLVTGTEGASVGLQDCAANEILKRNAGDTAWACAAVSSGVVTGISGDTGGTTTGAVVAVNGDAAGIDTVRSSDTITVQFDPTEVNTITWGDAGSATIDWLFSLSGATDPTLSFFNNVVRILASNLFVRGAAPTIELEDTDFSNASATTLTGNCASSLDCTTNLTYRQTGAAQTLVKGIAGTGITVGDSQAATVTITTNGTGDGELVVPDSSIATLEITDGTIAFADVGATQTLAGDPANGASSVWFGTTGMIFEGVTSDAFEGLLVTADITTPDKTWTLPNETGTICTTGSVCAGYQASGSLTHPQVMTRASIGF